MYNKIKKLMKQNGVSAYRVCKDTGISESTFTRWKNKTAKPCIDTLYKLSKYFGVSIDYFL